MFVWMECKQWEKLKLLLTAQRRWKTRCVGMENWPSFWKKISSLVGEIYVLSALWYLRHWYNLYTYSQSVVLSFSFAVHFVRSAPRDFYFVLLHFMSVSFLNFAIWLSLFFIISIVHRHNKTVTAAISSDVVWVRTTFSPRCGFGVYAPSTHDFFSEWIAKNLW